MNVCIPDSHYSPLFTLSHINILYWPCSTGQNPDLIHQIENLTDDGDDFPQHFLHTKHRIGLPRCSRYGIFTYIWLKFMVNVGKYSVHMEHMMGYFVSFPASCAELPFFVDSNLCPQRTCGKWPRRFTCALVLLWIILWPYGVSWHVSNKILFDAIYAGQITFGTDSFLGVGVWFYPET